MTDAWFPQVNGVVRTLDTVRELLTTFGHRVTLVSPDQFRSVPCPTYPEIRLALAPPRAIDEILDEVRPQAIHIATEGPLGVLAHWRCRRRGLPFTTSYHTRFPEYVAARWRVPLSWTYGFFRWFHAPASCVMVSTPSVEAVLREHGFTPL